MPEPDSRDLPSASHAPSERGPDMPIIAFTGQGSGDGREPKGGPGGPAHHSLSPLGAASGSLPGAAPLSSVALQLRERFWKLKADRVRANAPAATTRASSLGNPCERALYYERTVAADERVKHQPGTQAIFDLGVALERYVIREIEDMGCEIVQRGRDYLDRDLELSGHVDVSIRLPGWPKAVKAEIKGLNPYTAESIDSIDDIRGHRQGWVRKYYAQLQAYLHLSGDDVGVFVLLNKSTGQIAFIGCPRDEEYIREHVVAKALRIKAAVAEHTAPERHVAADCDRCPFAAVCAPPRDFGPGVSVIDHEELEALLARREQLVEAHREYVAVDKAAKALLPRRPGEILVGKDFVVVATERSRKAYSVQAASWVEFDIQKIGG
ncbi:MAG: hypothetical protein QME96_04530 [Myxococcota bacterium]|nr:hypothetical protein [Myxococcota bacterium]